MTSGCLIWTSCPLSISTMEGVAPTLRGRRDLDERVLSGSLPDAVDVRGRKLANAHVHGGRVGERRQRLPTLAVPVGHVRWVVVKLIGERERHQPPVAPLLCRFERKERTRSGSIRSVSLWPSSGTNASTVDQPSQPIESQRRADRRRHPTVAVGDEEHVGDRHPSDGCLGDLLAVTSPRSRWRGFDRLPRPESVGVETRWPRAPSRSATVRHSHPPSQAP